MTELIKHFDAVEEIEKLPDMQATLDDFILRLLERTNARLVELEKQYMHSRKIGEPYAERKKLSSITRGGEEFRKKIKSHKIEKRITQENLYFIKKNGMETFLSIYWQTL